MKISSGGLEVLTSIHVIPSSDSCILFTSFSILVKLPGDVCDICENERQTWMGYKEFVQQKMELWQKTIDGLNLNSLLGSYLIRRGTRNAIGKSAEF